MTTQTRARIERRETVRLRLGRIDDLPYVDAHAIAQHGHLIHQADVHVAVCVLQDLLHLGHRRAGHLGHAAIKHRLV